jgi:hypothetical protein
MNDFISFMKDFSALGYGVLSINLLLILFANYIIRIIYRTVVEDKSFIRRVRILRALNLLIIISSLYLSIEGGNNVGTKLIGVLGIIYFAFLSTHIINYFVLCRYGHKRKVRGEAGYVETYHSRLLSLFSHILIAIIALISIVQLLGFDSLLGAGGAIGFVGVLLALTQSTWAPDLFSGLILLNSNMLEEGDIILIQESEPVYGLVYKTKVFHTVILNLVDNHRIMIRNARLRDFTVHNLSKFASAKGLRETLIFKIGYDSSEQDVCKMMKFINVAVAEDKSIQIEKQYPLKIHIHDMGDHAVEWRVYYYTKKIESLPKIRQQLMALFFRISVDCDISLSTPLTHMITEIKH